MEKITKIEQFQDLKEGQIIYVYSGGKLHKDKITNVNLINEDYIIHTKNLDNNKWYAYHASDVLEWSYPNVIYIGE